jgi:catechol 2,3-dioxygenase-like lactoylglutathione lyase family enzyme
MEINGVAHVILSVPSVARVRAFYCGLLEHMGLMRVVDQPDYLYYVGGRTAVGLRSTEGADPGVRFDQSRTGLHHVCFRARSREDVDSVHARVCELGGTIVHPPEEAHWVPGYYSVLFEDPLGIRLEVNYVPGKGVFDPNVTRVAEPEEGIAVGPGVETQERLLIEQLYRSFNDHDVEGCLAYMHFDVEWANGLEGGSEVGHAAVRSYWSHQWQLIRPRVEPLAISRDAQGRCVVKVHQTVHDLTGKLLMDRIVQHAYQLEGGRVRRMQIIDGESGR